MNKINYLLIPVVIILLISNIFFYSNLSKQNLDIKKEQASQTESIENLQNLVTFNWKNYKNDKFGFSFKYPEYMNICNETADFQYIEKTELTLGIRRADNSGACDKLNTPLAQIRIKKNTENYKTAEEAFRKELSFINWSLNSQLGYLKTNQLNAYGGIIVSDSMVVINSNEQMHGIEGYDIVILKNDYIIKIYGINYGELWKTTEQLPKDKPILDTIISSLRFF